MAARKGAVRIVLFLAASAGARQAWNATAELAWLKDTCISARCSGGGACLPKFRRAPGAVKQGTAWVVAIRRVRRTSATDWANMEHFAAAALPAFDALFKAGERADYLVLPQVKDERAFGWARGADTDWYAGLSHAMGRALAERASSTAFANQKPTEFVFNGQLEACFQNVVHASYVPRATYTADARAAKALREAALFLSLSAAAGDSKAAGKGPLGGAAGRPGRPSGKIAAAVAAPAVQGALEPRGVDRSVTILLRPATDKAARRAGPGWTNARELVAELEGWLASNHVGWRLQVVALGHTYSFQTQLDLFQHTGVVVAAHGASLVNALLMRPGGAVVEVLNCGHRSSTYRNLAQHRGLAYFAATKAGRLRGDDCERDLGRKNIDTRRALPLSEIGPALEAAIKSVEATLKSAAKRPPSKRRGCGPSVDSALRFTRRPGNGTSAKDDLASLAQWIASARGSKSFAFVAECGLLRAASEVSLTVANPAEPVRFDRAFHASRRKLMAAVSGDRVGFAWAWDFALDVFANAFMESQRTANKLVFLHFSKAAGTSFCKLAKANKCGGRAARQPRSIHRETQLPKWHT
ncbi:hypothetical protein M885DRAFT_570861 [Pelagophyceae sp. CCMP2097]|nr:hypothetical protein M885DRAFT_570861 [Pelagophyceae sp. CCMP2097]